MGSLEQCRIKSIFLFAHRIFKVKRILVAFVVRATSPRQWSFKKIVSRAKLDWQWAMQPKAALFVSLALSRENTSITVLIDPKNNRFNTQQSTILIVNRIRTIIISSASINLQQPSLFSFHHDGHQAFELSVDPLPLPRVPGRKLCLFRQCQNTSFVCGNLDQVATGITS